jgi:DNA-directed RNA polymerase specialized sigma24 family protein
MGDKLVLFPRREEINFASLGEDHKQLEDFTEDEKAVLRTDALRLTKTAVFIERFFHKTPIAELAERTGAKPNTISCQYKQALKTLEKVLAAMDARQEGLKQARKHQFTDEQRLFMMVYCLGFSIVEASKIMDLNVHVAGERARRLRDKYMFAFKEVDGCTTINQ